jgi:uncharacterized protein YjiS (DUF1127 family)
MTTQSVSSHDNVFFRQRYGFSLRRRFIEMIFEWQRRIKSRHELACLSELELRDIGYPDRVDAEKSKPFWRA